MVLRKLVPNPSPLEVLVDPDHPDRYAQYVNIVASYMIVLHDGRHVKLDLRRIAQAARATLGPYYDSRSLRAIKMSIEVEHPAAQPTVMLFSTGMVNQTGAQTEAHALLTAHTLARLLTGITGVHLTVARFRRTNSVANTRLPVAINQEALLSTLGSARAFRAARRGHSRTGKPFSAVFVRCLVVPKIVFLFYSTGAVVIPGGKSDEQVLLAMQEIAEINERLRSAQPGQLTRHVSTLAHRDFERTVADAREIMGALSESGSAIDQFAL